MRKPADWVAESKPWSDYLRGFPWDYCRFLKLKHQQAWTGVKEPAVFRVLSHGDKFFVIECLNIYNNFRIPLIQRAERKLPIDRIEIIEFVNPGMLPDLKRYCEPVKLNYIQLPMRVWYRKRKSPGDNECVLGWRATAEMVEPKLSEIRGKLKKMHFETWLTPYGRHYMKD